MMRYTNPSATLRATAGLLLTAGLMLALAACANDPSQRLDAAAAAYAAGNDSVASIELRNVLQRDPDNAEARLLFGKVNLRQGDPASALEHLTRARQLGVESAEYARPLAQSLAALGRGDEALDVLDEIVAAERDGQWYLVRGNALFAERRFAAAEQALAEAHARAPDNADILVAQAQLAAAQGATDAAERLTERLIERDPDNPLAHQLRGELYLAVNNTAAAARSLERAVALYGRGSVSSAEIGASAALAQVLLATNDRAGVMRVRDSLQSRAPEHPATHYVAAAVDHLEGNYREAARRLQSALAEGESLQVLLLAGANHLALDNLGQAEQSVQRALALAPRQPAATRLLAETRRRQGRPRAALEALASVPGAFEDPQLLVQMGTLALQDGQPAEALRYLEQADERSPRTSVIQLQLARAYLALGRNDEAVALFRGPLGDEAERAVETAVRLLSDLAEQGGAAAVEARVAEMLEASPGDAETLMGAGLVYQALGEGDRARDFLMRSLAADSTFNPARVTLGALEAGRGEAAAARALFDDALAREPANLQALLGLAQLDSAEGADDRAADWLARAVRVAPANASVRLAQLRVAASLGNESELLRLADEAVQALPDDPDLVSFRGLVRLRTGRTAAGITDLERAAASTPPRASRWHNLGQAQFSSGEFRDARASLQRAVELEPRRVNSLQLLARTELQLGNPDEARRVARALQAAAPDSPAGYLLEGEAWSAREGWDEAARLYRQAYNREASADAAVRFYRARRQGGAGEATILLSQWLDQNPADTTARLLVAEYLQSQGQGVDAIREYERILALEPDNVVALNNVAWELTQLGQHERAIDYARRALQGAPDAPPVLDTFGWALVQAGRVEDGLSYLERAVALAPGAPDLRLHLGTAQLRAGQTEVARATLNTLLQQHPQYARRGEAEALLAEL